MRLHNLVQRLPKSDASLVMLAEEADHAFDVAATAIEGYVQPHIIVNTWPATASILVVEAPGAVGKSAAARCLAQELRWPLVTAENAQVGSYSLSGLVQDSLGFSSSYIQSVARGEAGIVIDSLDEAHFRAGSDNFLAFLDNVAQVSGGQEGEVSRLVSIVLFSRSDTAELIRLALEDSEVAFADARIDFFDLPSARDFIGSYLQQRFQETRRAEYNVYRASPVPFAKLRDDRLQQIGQLLLGDDKGTRLSDLWPDIKDFLGYAPVLVAIAESLAVTNPAREKVALHSNDQSRLLEEIIARILRREQNKFADKMYAKLRALQPADDETRFDASSLYKPDEQILRLVARLYGVERLEQLPATLPRSLRPSYEEAATTFAADHPFVRGREFASPVFADYVRAFCASSSLLTAHVGSLPSSHLDGVGPFFARMVHSLVEPVGHQVSEAVVPAIMHSWYQECEVFGSATSEARLNLSSSDESTLECWAERSGASSDTDLTFAIKEISGAFQIDRTIQNATVSTDSGIIVGVRGRQSSIGPSVILVAHEIVFECESIHIVSADERALVQVAGDSVTADYLVRVQALQDRFRVYTSDPPARLRPFSATLAGRQLFVPFEDLVDLRAVITAFKSSAHMGPSVYWEKMDRAIIKKNANRQSLLDQLIDEGVVSRDSQHYRLHTTQLSDLGFGITDVRSGLPIPALLDYLGHRRLRLDGERAEGE